MTDKLYSQAELDERVRLAQAVALLKYAEQIEGCGGVSMDVETAGQIGQWIRADMEDGADLLAKHDAELRAEAGAAMEKLITSEWPHDFVKNDNGEPVIERLCEDHRRHLRALIPTDYAATLDRLIAKARLEEAEWWAARIGFHNLKEGTEQARRLAELRRPADVAGKDKSNAKEE